jgi:pimeloyl-ACP methyl ester carboxylesterase
MKKLRTINIAVLAFVFGGCLGVPRTENPIPSIPDTQGNPNDRSVVIMLPGRGDRADTFIKHGFEQIGREHGFDTIAVDAHFGYYMRRNLMPRLHEDIVLRAKQAGYRKIWLLGVSMGGLGSLIYASNHPELVDGVILLAPFLGEEDVIQTIQEAGGLSIWDPSGSPLEPYENQMWSWLKSATASNDGTPVILAYGVEDRLAAGYEVLISQLPDSRVYTSGGGHKWKIWAPMWARIANDLDL